MPEVIASTTAGELRGLRSDRGVCAFKGIPYAAPPVGRLRFLAPAPPLPWAEVRDATAYGASCPQPEGPGLASADRVPTSEDCLVLNVWTPALAGRHRPVLVWFHGGGYAMGSGSSPLYDGAALAGRGDAVVVTVNHRLGPLGYLHLGDLSDEPELAASGNAGLLDLVAALEWVQREIHGFGGDAGNVTVFGESGGGAKICALLAMPAAAGLFHRAVVQSGALLRVRSVAGGTRTAEVVLGELGISRRSLDRLWQVPAAALVEASLKLGRRVDGRALVPVLDGTVLPRHPEQALAEGTAHDVPVIVGSNRDEGAAMLPDSLDGAELRTRLTYLFGDTNVGAIEATYRREYPQASSVDHLSYAVSDSGMRLGAIRLAELKAASSSSTPVYEYFFTYELGGRAGHGYEIAFVFDNLGPGARSGARRALADEMSEAWLAFARSGDPNHPGLAPWPPFRMPDRSTMIFQRGESAAARDPSAATRELWAKLPVQARARRTS